MMMFKSSSSLLSGSYTRSVSGICVLQNVHSFYYNPYIVRFVRRLPRAR